MLKSLLIITLNSAIVPAVPNDGAGMFVCNCHGIRMRDVDAACAAGCRTPREVFAHAADAEPCCGRCVPEIRERMHRLREATPVAAE